MNKAKLTSLVVIGGGLLLLVQLQNYTRKIAFKQGIECILEGGERGVKSVPKICVDFYVENNKDLMKRIESTPDTKEGRIEKGIWIRHLNDFNYIRVNGLTKTFFQTGLERIEQTGNSSKPGKIPI